MQTLRRTSSISVDVARLTKAVELGIAQSLTSPALVAAVPPGLRDPGHFWVGLSERARVVYASKDRVPETTITYEDLADPKYEGRICIRSGQHQYNLALFGAMIAKHGEANAKAWLEGLKANLARKPSGGDRDVAKDIAAGACDIGLGNTYYVGLMRGQSGAEGLGRRHQGHHADLQGRLGGRISTCPAWCSPRTRPNKANAIKLAEWLVSDEAQHLYAETNFEYPVKAGIAVSPDGPGVRHARARHAARSSEIAKNRKAASEMVDAVGFDN